MKEQTKLIMQIKPEKLFEFKRDKGFSPIKSELSLLQGYNINNVIPIENGSVISDEVLKALINFSTDIITVLSPDGTILYESDSNEKILGYKRNEIIGTNAFSYIHKDDIRKVFQEFNWGLLNPGTSIVSLFRFRKSDGSYTYLESTGTNINTSVNNNIVVISRDVSGRVENDKKFNRLSAAVEQSSNTIVVTDIEGYIVYVNKNFVNLTGYEKEEVIGSNSSLLSSGETMEETYKELWATILTGNVWEGELRNKKKSGELYWERIKITPVVDEKDLITNFIAIKDDVTNERKINKMLEQSLLEKEIMLKEIHHRVKNNLQIVISLLNLQSNSVDDINLKNQLTISQNRVRSMALIHQLLYKSVDLSGIDMEDYLLSLSSQLLASYIDQKKSIKIKVNAKSIFFSIETAVPFGLLVNELVTNSLKHGFPEGRNGNLEITLTQIREEQYELNYIDDGIGIPLTVISGHVLSFGMHLIEMLVSQLEGDIKHIPSNGTNYTINFRGSNYQTRLHYP